MAGLAALVGLAEVLRFVPPPMDSWGFRIRVSGFGVKSLGLRGTSLGFRVSGLGFRVEGVGFK